MEGGDPWLSLAIGMESCCGTFPNKGGGGGFWILSNSWCVWMAAGAVLAAWRWISCWLFETTVMLDAGFAVGSLDCRWSSCRRELVGVVLAVDLRHRLFAASQCLGQDGHSWGGTGRGVLSARRCCSLGDLEEGGCGLTRLWTVAWLGHCRLYRGRYCPRGSRRFVRLGWTCWGLWWCLFWSSFAVPEHGPCLGIQVALLLALVDFDSGMRARHPCRLSCLLIVDLSESKNKKKVWYLLDLIGWGLVLFRKPSQHRYRRMEAFRDDAILLVQALCQCTALQKLATRS